MTANERGPVGGAGELPFLLGKLRGIGEALRTTNIFRGREIMQLADDIERAAKASQGVPSREQFERELYAGDEQLTHKAIMRVFDAAAGDRPSSEGGGLAANPGYPAPESTGGPQKMAVLPVPGPVSDTTIHHGMFPPAASGAAPSLSPNRKFVYRFLELPHHKKMAIGQELKLIEEGDPEKDAEMFTKWFARARERGQLSRMQELVMGEAAAPKPAPDATEERALATARGDFSTFPLCVPSAEKLMELREKFNAKFETKGPARPDRTVGGTPAPGAERLPSRGQLLSAIEQGIANWRVYGSSEIQDEGHLKGMIIEQLYRTPALREALAAAPPAPTNDHELLVGGVVRAALELAILRGDLRMDNGDSWEEMSESEREDVISDTWNAMNGEGTCEGGQVKELKAIYAALAGGRHASAERVRELIAKWRDSVENAPKSFAGPHRPIGALNRFQRKMLSRCADELERALPPSTGEKRDGQ